MSTYACSYKPVLHRLVEPGQYTSIRFTETLALQGLSASIGTIGDAYDAVAESFIGLFKNEPSPPGRRSEPARYAPSPTSKRSP
jgi:hypothetical protein